MISFLNSMLLWGTLLGAIPIIIHLLNRRRFRRVQWAPMRYLKLTIQRNRRRIQLEELLLLLLRLALIVLLFFFLARPVLNPSGLEGWLGTGGRSSQVVLIDDSMSMGYTSGGSGSFQEAKEQAAAVLAAIRPQDRCTLITTSVPRVPLLHEIEGTRHDELASAALSVPLTSTHAAWPAILEGADEVLRSCTYPTRQLTIVTDLRKSGWEPAVSTISRRWRDQEIRVRIVDVGATETANVSLESLSPVDRTILAGAPSKWEATIKNDSTRTLANTKGILRIDDRPIEVPLPDIAPREVARLPLTVSFPGAGPHELSFQIPEDELAEDNQRWVSVPVKDSLLIRLVDGEPSSEPFGSEVDYLAAPLSVGIGDAEAWRVEVVPENDFLSPRLDPADVLVLANVAAPTPEQAEKLRQLVKAGMGLIIFSGGKLDVALYDDLLHRGEDPLLPYRLKGLVDENIQGLFVEPVRPSPLEKLLDLKPSALERIAIRQFMTIEEQGDKDKVRVLARWNNPTRAAAIAERVVGAGRVLLWTTTADRGGNDWPIEPSFVLAAREAVRGTARPTPLDHTVTAGEPIRRAINSSHPITNARLSPPGGAEPKALAVVPVVEEKTERAPTVEITVSDTRKAGSYRVNWDEGPLGSQQDLYAVNPDPRESRLEPIESPELKRLLEPLNVEVIAARNGGAALSTASGREIWRDLATALLVMMIAEAIFATWVGRSR